MTEQHVSKIGRNIPLSQPELAPEDVQAVLSVLAGTQLALGPQITAFERAIADYVGTPYAVAVNSGTSALHLIVRALGISAGDEVITTPFSFIASTNCILMEGAVPVFVDIDPQTLCIDPDLVEAAITPRTVAILAVDAFGHPAAWDQLERIAQRRGLALIEDSAESLGSRFDDKPCGSFGRAAIFGFYPNKQITTGEGGMITTNDNDLAECCRSMANQGRGDARWLSHVRLGYNYRLDEMSAALGASQMKRIETIVAARTKVAEAYLEAMAHWDDVILPRVAENVRMSWFVFVVRLADRFSREDRDRILARLQSEGIGCRDYFQPIHLQPFIRQQLGTARGDFPVTEAMGDRAIALPFFPQMTGEQVLQVVEALSGAISC
ncbi:DegT/DnrJ/EryC1/StrS family aminotransferase [Candidatus Bipolaricaulota bacterium]|nr:DegT/DnrJ/EryC1/StrS family aminotransferase [Candidatus Bipolaricaulota bacterium]